MMEVMTLKLRSMLAVVDELVGMPTDSAAQYIKWLLRSDAYSAVSDDVVKIMAQDFAGHLDDDLLLLLATPSCKRLSLANCSSLTPYGIREVFKRCCNLESLNLSKVFDLNCITPQPCHCAIARLCKCLIERPCNCSVTFKTVPHLTRLILDDCKNVTNHTVRSFLRNLTHLQHLSLARCPSVDDYAFLFYSEDEEVAASNYNTSPSVPCQLAYINLSGCVLISSMAVLYLLDLWGPYLRHIDLSLTSVDCLAFVLIAGCTIPSCDKYELFKNYKKSRKGGRECDTEREANVTIAECSSRRRDMSVGAKVEYKISSLSIGGNQFRDAATIENDLKMFVESAGMHLRRLALFMDDLTSRMLSIIARHAPNLVEINLDCTRRTGQSIISEGLTDLITHCKKLERIILDDIVIVNDGFVNALNDENVIRTLNIPASYVTDSTLHKISKYCSKQLTELDLSWCEVITDMGLQEICQCCTRLAKLVLQKVAFSDASGRLLANSNWGDLVHLNIANPAESCSDESIVALALHMNKLVYVNISWHTDVTDVGISSVLFNCPRLCDLILSGLRLITISPFLPIISGHETRDSFQHEKSTSCTELDVEQRFEARYPLSRSRSYATNLRELYLEYCNLVNDDELRDIAGCCHGSLRITDYYSCLVEGSS